VGLAFELSALRLTLLPLIFCHAIIAVFINPGAASLFGSKSKSENSRVPEP
jgi:hypothetical protein